MLLFWGFVLYFYYEYHHRMRDSALDMLIDIYAKRKIHRLIKKNERNQAISFSRT